MSLKTKKPRKSVYVEGVKISAPRIEEIGHSLGHGVIIRDELISFLLRCPPVVYCSVIDIGGVSLHFVVNKASAKKVKPKDE